MPTLTIQTVIGSVAVIGALWLSGCLPAGYQTPNPSRFNEGLNSFFPDQEPGLTEDGRYLVFSSSRGGFQAIYLYDRQTNQLVDLPNLNSDQVANSSPDISGDGRYIVYLSNELGKSEVFLYDRETQVAEDLTSRIPGDVRHPTINGDGSVIAFESNGLGEWNLSIIERDRRPPVTEPTQ